MSRTAAPAPVRTTAGVIPLSVEESMDAAVPMSTVVAIVFALAAAWMAAGSAGLFGHSLRHALTWVLLGVAGVGGGARGRSGGGWGGGPVFAAGVAGVLGAAVPA